MGTQPGARGLPHRAVTQGVTCCAPCQEPPPQQLTGQDLSQRGEAPSFHPRPRVPPQPCVLMQGRPLLASVSPSATRGIDQTRPGAARALSAPVRICAGEWGAGQPHAAHGGAHRPPPWLAGVGGRVVSTQGFTLSDSSVAPACPAVFRPSWESGPLSWRTHSRLSQPLGFPLRRWALGESPSSRISSQDRVSFWGRLYCRGADPALEGGRAGSGARWAWSGVGCPEKGASRCLP